MSDIMRPIPFHRLMTWVLKEYESHHTIFGAAKFVYKTDGKMRPIFDEKIETPFGPAAGPHTQLAQNIIAAYVTGARFFELKTVQNMDGPELAACINKPCILASDEGYNCEWSTELTVPQAFEEYAKAWVACKILAKEFGFGDPDGFVFNMSVGYDYEGITTSKIDTYINNMIDASETLVFQKAIAWALDNVDRFKQVDSAFISSITPHISRSITESTLHGCPPDEIERIATHLIKVKDLNTYVKCNPTLLGYEYARKTLDSLGFDYLVFDDHHFAEDLQWADAVPMFERLVALAKGKGLEFGVKLTNTFPVDVAHDELPSEEMYMSGRPLYPLSLTVAERISEQFKGKLRISYSGGADATNICDLVDAGIWPVTMATTLLKPGGYERMTQIADVLANINDQPFSGVDAKKVKALVRDALTGTYCRKAIKSLPDRHIKGDVPLVDCFVAPCREDCPVRQDIPGYLRATAEGRFADALGIILERNALPFITGTICPHTCGNSCMRNYYDEHVHIRDFKLKAAQKGFEDVLPTLAVRGKVSGKKVAIIGAGPSGLSAASFLSRAGVEVTVFERTDKLGGIVRYVIPGFRISNDAIDHDVELCRAYGAQFKTATEITNVRELFNQGYTDVIVAIGAWAAGSSVLRSGTALDAIEFLQAFKGNPASINLGTDVIVLGGGNTAMDVARAAKRVPGVKKVRLVYRRTRRYMPADEEELQMALDDGVEFMELLAPGDLVDASLTCDVMRLGALDASGRRRPEPTGETVTLPATAVIAAVGEKVESGLYRAAEIEVDKNGLPVVDYNLQTSVPHVFAIGDARRGPATVVEGIADAATVTSVIAGFDFSNKESTNLETDSAKVLNQRGGLCSDCSTTDRTRCLSCPTICETCCEVCPNRANVSIKVSGMRQTQIVHLDSMCNECGNCAVFCPYTNGRPYKDKFTLFSSREDFDASENEGFLALSDGYLVRLNGTVGTYDINDDACGLPSNIRKLIVAVRDRYSYVTGSTNKVNERGGIVSDQYTFTVNGKDGCSEGACGTCTVVIDGIATKGCVISTKRAQGKTIETVEGLSDEEKEAFVYAFGAVGAVQCGFCIPGMVMSGIALVRKNPNPSEDEVKQAIRGNICRCTGYKKIIEGILKAAAILRGDEQIDFELERGDDYGIGKRAFRVDVRRKVLGYGKYPDDLNETDYPDMVYASAVRSKFPRARVLRIDSSKAKAFPGVLGVLTAKDIPVNKVGHIMQDWDVMIAEGDITRCMGDAICLVVAEDAATLAEAKKLVEVTYEELEPVRNIFEARAEGAPLVHEGVEKNICQSRHVFRGDAKAALANSAYTVTQTFEAPFTEHAFLEPECAVAFPYKDGVKVQSSDQGAYDSRKEIHMFGWDETPERVVVETMLVGGGFGGKEDVSVQHLAALAAFHFGRTVKCKLSRKESLLFHPKRHAIVATFTLGCDKDGLLTGLDCEINFDTGAYASLCGPVLERACTHAVGPYKYQNTTIHGYGYYTNNPPAGAFRGFGVSQSEFALESLIDLLAEKAGISLWEIRYRNAIEPGYALPNGQIADCSTALKETLLAVKDIYDEHVGHCGLACAMKNSGIGVGLPDKGRCKIRIEEGKAVVYAATSDIGQGCNTVFLQDVAEACGLPRFCVLNGVSPSVSTNTTKRWKVGKGLRGNTQGQDLIEKGKEAEVGFGRADKAK